MEDILYTPEEIAQKLKITKQTVYEMIKRGDLDAHRIGKHLRISSAQYELYFLRAKGTENIFEAQLHTNASETLATVGPVEFSVNSTLTGQVRLSIRPEDILLSKGTFVSSARNMHHGRVSQILLDDGSAKVTLDIGVPITALITKKSLDEMQITLGTELYAVFKAMAVKVFK